LGYISVAERLGIYSSTFTQYALKATEVAEITQKWPLRRSRSFKVTDLIPIESSYTTSYKSLILTYILCCTVSEI